MDPKRRQFAEALSNMLATDFDYAASLAQLCTTEEIYEGVAAIDRNAGDQVLDLISKVRARTAQLNFEHAIETAQRETDNHAATLRRRRARST